MTDPYHSSNRVVTYREEAAKRKRERAQEALEDKQSRRRRSTYEYQKREWPVLSERQENIRLTIAFLISVAYIITSIIVGFSVGPAYVSEEAGFNLAPPTQAGMFFTILFPLYWVLWPIFLLCLMWPGVNIIVAGLLYAGPVQTLFILSGVIASPYVYKIARRLLRVVHHS